MLQTAGNNIQTDLSLNQLAGLAWDFRKVNGSNLSLSQEKVSFGIMVPVMF